MFRRNFMNYGAIACGVLFATVMMSNVRANDSAGDQVEQAAASATPLRVVLPTSTIPATAGLISSPTPTYTPQAEGPVQLQARQDAGAVNIRADADPNADRLGSIQYGDLYPVLGRYFRWLQIQFDSSPTGRGWVFEELVEIVGDPARIPDLNESLLPTQDTSIIAATQTWEALEQLPGGFLTLTADARVIQAPSSSESSGGVAQDAGGPGSNVLPTYTYPPNITPQAPISQIIIEETATPGDNRITISVSDGVAPIVPILILGVLGVIGLLISGLRR